MNNFFKASLAFAVGLLCGCGNVSNSSSSGDGALTLRPNATPTSTRLALGTPTPVATRTGRGFPLLAPWASCYGSAEDIGDLSRVARTFRVINIDADPGVGNFSRAQITQLRNGGANRVISYLNLGSCESFRSYWTSAPPGFVAAKNNKAAQAGAYEGYPDETWMDVGNAAYQHLMLDYVAPRLVAQGVDGFYLDNLEIIEHGAQDTNGACDATCRQGGLDMVRKLREKYPHLLIVMQNATGEITRLGTTGGVAFPTLLDGIAHEEVYAPQPDEDAERELLAWQSLGLRPGGKRFWIATEDYVGSGANVSKARKVYARSRAQGFSPYVADDSGKQQKFFFWPF